MILCLKNKSIDNLPKVYSYYHEEAFNQRRRLVTDYLTSLFLAAVYKFCKKTTCLWIIIL